jgi:RNA polymerase sigma-70 factor (ECF subfamily)
MDHEPDEAALGRRAGAGDREALVELIERVRGSLFALAYAELRHYEDAQDAVASTLLQVCRHVGELRQPERVRAWMHQIVRNEARLLLRRRGVSSLSLEKAETAAEARETPAAADPSSSILRFDIERALRQLPREEAHATALFYLTGLSLREIAARLGRPEGTIKRWLHFGRRHLAAELEEYAPMKRREALELLAAAPVAMTAMEECRAMTPTPAASAAIVSTDFDPTVLQGLVTALKRGGWTDVAVLRAVPPLEERTTADGAREVHLPVPLYGRQLIVLDEWVGGRSAFELLALLKIAAEAKETVFGLLLNAPAADSTVFAAWGAGFDLCLTKPVQPAEFERFGRHILEQGKHCEPA